MTLEELRDINRRAEAAVGKARERGAHLSEEEVAYYGYVTVDQLDCPPFLMFTNNDSPTVQKLLATNVFERTSMAVWCAFARRATGILDIGANVGIYSLAAAKLRPDIEVHAFEPNPFAYARLRMHKHVNRLPNIAEHPVAVGAKNVHAKFAWTAKPGGSISSGGTLTGYEGDGVENTVVQVVTFPSTNIASTLGERPLIKIDVEGAELDVFRSLDSLLPRRPDILFESFNADACAYIQSRIAPLEYFSYLVLEDDGVLEQRPGVAAAAKDPPYNFNQLLTCRSPDSLGEILPKGFKIRSLP